MSFKSGHLWRSNDVVSIFNMATAVAQYYFRFRICWRQCHQEIKMSPTAKFCRHGSIIGWERYNYFRLGKTISAILEFYFRFPFWPYCRNPRDILHKYPKFHQYRSTQCGNMTPYRFFKMAAAAAQYYFRFPFVDVTVFRRSTSISKPNVVDISEFRAEI